MITTKFQSEPSQNALHEDRMETRVPGSAESIVANLESIILGLCIRNYLSRNDVTNLGSLLAGPDRLFIIKDKNCIYPTSVGQDEFSFCLVFNGDELNVCDLNNGYPHIAARLEHTWPLMLVTAKKIKDAFETSNAALLINRTSGRIMAASAGYTSITGIHEDMIVGCEYSEASRKFEEFFAGKQLGMTNLKCDEVYMTLLMVTVTTAKSTGSTDNHDTPRSDENSHKFIDEFQAVGMHVDRFNALLETNLHIAISPEMLNKLDAIITEIIDYRTALPQTSDTPIDSSNIKASLRLLIQSVLMSHRSLAGESARTEIAVCRSENNDLQIKFDTPTVIEPKPQSEMNEWWQLVGNLSKRIDIRIGELQFTGKSIINRIHLK